MLATLKRYGMALIFLFLVIVLMIFSTMAVKDFGENMLEDTNMTMKPRGEEIVL